MGVEVDCTVKQGDAGQLEFRVFHQPNHQGHLLLFRANRMQRCVRRGERQLTPV
jgi:hypothetical protein